MKVVSYQTKKRLDFFIRFIKTVKHKCGIKHLTVKLKFIFFLSGISHSSFDIRTLHFTKETYSGQYFKKCIFPHTIIYTFTDSDVNGYY